LCRYLARHTREQGIAGTVTEGIVDMFELIDVEKQQSHAAAMAVSAGEHAREFFLETMAVV
jgi:hypothetical protein